MAGTRVAFREDIWCARNICRLSRTGTSHIGQYFEKFSRRDYIVVDVCLLQVYFQLDSQREVLRTLRRLLKEKFDDSEEDCPPDAFVENQEVIVKWKDGEWARAR